MAKLSIRKIVLLFSQTDYARQEPISGKKCLANGLCGYNRNFPLNAKAIVFRGLLILVALKSSITIT